MQKQTQYQITTTAVISFAHFDPFGMRLPGKTYTNPKQTNANKYLYNGKEMQNDFELQWYDYGARYYDAQTGRFHSIDPMIEYHYNYTGYAYVYNNPINLIDPFGLDTLPAIITPYGNIEPHKELKEISIKPYTQILSMASEINKDLNIEANQNKSEIKENKPNKIEMLEKKINEPIDGVGDAIAKTTIKTILGIANDANVFFSSLVLVPEKSNHLDGEFANKNEITDAGVMTLLIAFPLQKTGNLLGIGASRTVISKTGIVKFKTNLRTFRQGVEQSRMTKTIIVGKAAAKSSKRLEEKFK